MTEPDECMHLLDPATCTICNGRDKRETQQRRHHMDSTYPASVVVARFEGWCDECHGTIESGQDIIAADGRWIHERCP